MLYPAKHLFPNALLFPTTGFHGPVPPGRTHHVRADDRTETVRPR